MDFKNLQGQRPIYIKRKKTPMVYTRRNVYSLNPNGTEIASLRQGIRAMRARPSSDPTSWTYQAAIHGSDNPPPPSAAWNQCQHGSFFFLSWHRMYLYWFERILRAASGNSNLALPYWDYSNSAMRALPVAFRNPANASNPLYISQRSRLMNLGYRLPASDVNYSIAFRYVNFMAPTDSGLSFGGQEAEEAGHFLTPHGQLESQPHDIVHVRVGGSQGWMTDPNRAAQDPIFWLHHANIDRLWKRWLDQGGGRANPTDNAWLTTRFTFSDENGERVTMAGQDILDTVNRLDYTYDDDPPHALAVPFVHEISARAIAHAAIPIGSRTVLATTGGANMIELSTQPVKVTVQMDNVTRNQLLAAAAANVVRNRFVLNLEGIDYEQNPGVSYEVYINLPEGQEPNYQSDYYVGNLGFFALKPHVHVGHSGHGAPASGQPGGKRSFDITHNIRALEARGEWHEQVEVTFIMSELEPPDDTGIPVAQPPATAAAEPTPSAQIARVTITTE